MVEAVEQQTHNKCSTFQRCTSLCTMLNAARKQQQKGQKGSNRPFTTLSEHEPEQPRRDLACKDDADCGITQGTVQSTSAASATASDMTATTGVDLTQRAVL